MYNIDTITPDNINQSLESYKTGGMLTADDETEVVEVPFDSSPQGSTYQLNTPQASPPYHSLINGNWYANNPDRNLGDIVVANDRYGKEIKVVTGSIANIEAIVASDDFSQFIKSHGIGVSIIDGSVTETINKPENEAFVKGIIGKSNASIGKKAVRSRNKKEDFANDTSIDEMQKVQPYWEVFKQYNPAISEEELKAYIWYKDVIGQKLSHDWYVMANYFSDDRDSNQMISDWVKSGVLCYYNGELLPQVLYLSGNMYEKITRIVKSGENSGQDIDYIVSNFGRDVLVNQLEAINRKYNEVYSKRLMLTGHADDNSLIIKPISTLAREFKVSSLQEYESFKWWESKGQPNWDREEGRNAKTLFDELSLTDAFCYWMVNVAAKLEILGNITYRDIIYFYIDGRTKMTPSHYSQSQEDAFKAELQRTKSKSMAEGNRLFLKFLDEQLELNDKVRLETTWNSQYNNYLPPDFNKIPVAFNVAKEFGGELPFVVKPEKREAAAYIFNEGSGALVYDVGVGKTMSAIMTIEQFLVAGYCKRPFIAVPNQTFKQWVSEIKGILPHRKVNALFNLGVDYAEEVQDEDGNTIPVAEGSITVITLEGLRQIGFNEVTESQILTELYDILSQGGVEEKMSAKKKAGFFEKLESLVGRGLKNTFLNIEDLGLDFMCIDEAHAAKKVFTSVKGESRDGKKEKNPYSISSGTPSDTAIKCFMLSQFILRNNNYRNVLLLTATPFTNSPLEVYSMLSLVAYHHLAKLGINNLKDFFDTYIDAETDLVVNHKLQPQYKQIIKGFNNLPALQRIVLRFFNYKDGDDVGVVRPSKIVIPYLKKMVNNVITPLPEDEQVNCFLTLTDVQKRFMAEIIEYAESGTPLGGGLDMSLEDEEEQEGSLVDTARETVNETYLNEKEKSGVRALRAMNHSRNLALSPYLYAYSGMGRPTYKKYIETSSKLQYVVNCIKSVKKYHEQNDEPVSGQVIYMDRGIQYFGLIAEYLVKECGFLPHEIGMIYSKGMSVDKKRAVQDAFLGRKYNDKTQEYEDIPDSQRIKVLIGSSSIKEGMNLQKKSTVLYNCFLDWNPTDMVQLEGRIWRQQNEFLYVRIVNPLMIDSIDIFMFQKLEEKTARINSIWSNDGRSVLKIEDVNPAEIKYALIKDPKVLANIEIDEKKINLEDDIKSNYKLNDRLDEYKKANNYIITGQSSLDDHLKIIAPDKLTSDLDVKLKTLATYYRNDTPRDSEGRIMVFDHIKDSYHFSQERKRIVEEHGPLSPHARLSKPYRFDTIVMANRLIQRENKDLLKPRNISPDNIDEYMAQLHDKSEVIKEEIKFLESPDYIEQRVQQILEYREKNKIVEKSISQLVKEFERLNPLLSKKRIKTPPAAAKAVFQRLNPDGSRKTDELTLQLLEQEVMRLPQTKALHTNAAGEYTDERRAIHLKIINSLKTGVACIGQEAPIAILTGGSPASGKSSFLKTYAPYLLSEEIYHVDADEVRAMLPEYEGWNATATHQETKDIVNTLLTDKEIGIPCNFDLIYDGTMNNSKNYLPLIGTLKRLGYRIFIVYMDNVPYSVVKERMIGRYEKTGRFVPMEVINDFFGKGKEALFELKNKVDGYMIVDASSKDYRIIEQGGMQLPKDRRYSEMQRITDRPAEVDQDKAVIDGIKLNRYREPNGKTEIRMEKAGDIFGIIFPSIIYPGYVSNETAIAAFKKHVSGKPVDESTEPSNQDIQDTVEGLEVLLTITTGKEATEIQDTIEGLKVLLLLSDIGVEATNEAPAGGTDLATTILRSLTPAYYERIDGMSANELLDYNKKIMNLEAKPQDNSMKGRMYWNEKAKEGSLKYRIEPRTGYKLITYYI